MNSILAKLKLNGFVNAGPLALTAEEVKELTDLSQQIYLQMGHDHPDYLQFEEGVGGVRGIPQHHPRIAELLNKLISAPEVEEVLQSVLGPVYKIWQINFRRSLPSDKGLSLHQDSPGQVNMCILLSDNSQGDGATVFLPSTHMLKERIRELKLEASSGVFNLIRPMLTMLSGRAGDVGFLFNRTWHGRTPNKTAQFQDIIMLGFYPADGYLHLHTPYLNWSRDFLNSIEHTKMGLLLDPQIGTVQESEGKYKILHTAESKNQPLPFAFEIENLKDNDHHKTNYRLRISVACLKFAMGSGRPFKRLLRKLKA